ncbi:MAG: tetratricopeptide repeat protein [Bacteroidetes bacterium SB0662_bin_6]|nr:tetratricopeptide repeat protein [Bacteroidetes bacterium SB0668_bin_1]MYE04985.1 tetratricopeptide repeat protein [Bacteroidetes bacterium SB0662_bin_6]
MRTRHIFLLLGFLFLSHAGYAQSADHDIEEGVSAFQEGSYEKAEQVLLNITESDPDRAEAHYLLARLYTETPLSDPDKAEDALDEAIRIEPENPDYLVAKLLQLRKKPRTVLQERIREQRRIALSKRILSIDSANAFAHEELGTLFIRDFWRYRNALMFPSMAFSGNLYRGSEAMALGDPPLALQESPLQEDLETDDTFNDTEASPQQIMPAFAADPTNVFLADRFDVEELEEQGVPVLDLSGRAQHAYERAVAHLEDALSSDPLRHSVYRQLMKIYALKGEYDTAREMLENMHASFPEDPSTWLYLGLAQAYGGDPQGAASAFETALQYMDNEEKIVFETLSLLLLPTEEELYEEDPVTYASRFWASKDPRYLTPWNERKIEHYARLVYADLLYGSEGLELRGWDTERGHILVRYGPPERDVVIVPGSSSGVRDVGLAPTSRTDSRAVPTPTDMSFSPRTAHIGGDFDMLSEANTFNIWDYGDFRFVFEDPFRNGEYRLYSPTASDMSAGVPAWLNDYSIIAEETIARTPELYEYEAPGRRVDIPFVASAFKGSGEDADIYVSYGIPISEDGIQQETIDVAARIGAFLVSERRDILVERRQTIYGLRGDHIRSFDEAHLWVGGQVMTAPPGQHEVSMEFETVSGGTIAVQRRAIEVPDFTEDELQVSDLMLAYTIEEADPDNVESATVHRGEFAIISAPWNVFSHRQPIYLFFEIYRLTRTEDGETQYEMEARLTPRNNARGIARVVRNIFGTGGGVSVSVPGSGSLPDETNYLILDAANQAPGLYTLTLRVRDLVSGKSVERTIDLFLE